jgi:hypothetical protein
VSILEHRKKKGRNSNGQIELKVQREQGLAAWELEQIVKDESLPLYDQYWQKVKAAE